MFLRNCPKPRTHYLMHVFTHMDRGTWAWLCRIFQPLPTQLHQVLHSLWLVDAFGFAWPINLLGRSLHMHVLNRATLWCGNDCSYQCWSALEKLCLLKFLSYIAEWSLLYFLTMALWWGSSEQWPEPDDKVVTDLVGKLKKAEACFCVGK